MLLVILINGLFSFWQKCRAESAIVALQRLLSHRVKAPSHCAAQGRHAATELTPGGKERQRRCASRGAIAHNCAHVLLRRSAVTPPC